MKQNNQKGIASVTLIVGLLVGILILSAASYYVLKYSKPTSSGKSVPTATQTGLQSSATPQSVSTKNDAATLEKELNETGLDSLDKDLNSLDTSVNSL